MKRTLPEQLISEILYDITGESRKIILDANPSGNDVYAGFISPRLKKGGVILQGNPMSQVFKKFYPMQVGFSFVLNNQKKANLKGEIRISFFCYYRVFPSPEQQKEWINRSSFPLGVLTEELEEEIEEIKVKKDDLRIVFKKTRRIDLKLEFKIEDLLVDSKRKELLKKINFELEKEIEQLKDEIKKDPFIWKQNITTKDIKKLIKKLHNNEDDFQDTIKNLEKQPLIPKWKARIRIEEHKLEYNNNKIMLSLILENNAEQEQKSKKEMDLSLFGVKLELRFNEDCFEAIKLPYFDEKYLEEQYVVATGINCSISPESSRKEVKIDLTPIFEQFYIRPISNENCRFDVLNNKEKALQALREIRKDMENYYENASKLLTEKKDFTIEREKKSFERIIKKFSSGIRLLENDNKAMDAFIMMNKAMKNASKHDAWYLFQIIFIVSQIPDILSIYRDIKEELGYIHSRKEVELIWFPTGGGKTEAFLGLIVFHLFLDRFYGKKEGVTAIVRFPMRILSLQQLQRIYKVLFHAELLRKKDARINNDSYAPFSLGYFAGSSSTPNVLIKNSGNNYLDDPIPDDIADSCTVITDCLYCNEKNSIKLTQLKEEKRLALVCNNCKNILDVYVTDEEIYRFLPSVIVSTLDKFASATWRREFRNIFGGTTIKCPEHGFGLNKGCWYKIHRNIPNEHKCRVDIDNYKDMKNLGYYIGPTLLIVDELHLLRDELGAFASHYEGMIHTIIEELSQKHFRKISPKVIAASATIQRFEEQVMHLFLQQGHSFPSRLPIGNDYNTFFAKKENKIRRYIVGIKPHGITLIYALQRLLEAYERSYQPLWRKKLPDLEKYLLLLSYNQRIIDADQLSHSMETMVNQELKEESLEGVNFHTLTGDSQFVILKKILSKWENIEDANLKYDPRLVIATSLISHGVDVSLLNVMFFRGMPKTTSEYIQAFSRVGRKYPGIVFILFDHTRERDVSYYTYFQEFHKYMEYLVEPVPINRWARHGIKKTLPGLFSFTVIGLLESLDNFDIIGKNYSDYHTAEKFRKALNKGDITVERIKSYILKYYFRERKIMAPNSKEIEKMIEEELLKILNEIEKTRGLNYLPSAMGVDYEAMTSLRDIEETFKIKPGGKVSSELLKSVSISYILK